MGGQAGVIGSGEPEGIITTQGAVTGLDVLKGEKQRVAQVKLPGDVGRGMGRNHGLGRCPGNEKPKRWIASGRAWLPHACVHRASAWLCEKREVSSWLRPTVS